MVVDFPAGMGRRTQESMRKIISNARVVTPGMDLANGFVVIEEGRIVAIGEGNLPVGDAEVIDAGGKSLLPGFIDIHSHGADGHDVCDDSLESLRHIARRKLQEGVTTWLPTTLTQPVEKLRSIAGKIAAFRDEGGLTRCPGMHVEGPFINRDKTGAQNPEYVRPPDFAELAALHEIMPALIVSLAPEMPGAVELIAAAAAFGIRCSAAHTASTSAQIFAACDAGL
ncbi:MAG: naga: n-acetylglucosamine-6-phosphate deacetylase, partial [Akkermansiaceae bacterium]|nr:naga: n-acetylglucosamine-6-phosphate deacetylase [Akkermansiaceae bacterium]